MIIKPELLKKLKSSFNLNIYEVKIWTALLSKGVATAGELSDMSNVPRSRSYDVLESLEKKGFVIMKIGRPIKYLAVKPEEIISRVKRTIQEKATEDITELEKVRTTDVFKDLDSLFKHGIDHIDPAAIAGSFRGRSQTYTHILSLLSEAEKEVIIVTTAEGLVRKGELLKANLKKLKAQKILLKIFAPLITEEAKEAAKDLQNYATVKNIDLHARFLIVDEKDLVFMVSDDKKIHESADVGIWVSTPFFAKTLKNLLNA